MRGGKVTAKSDVVATNTVEHRMSTQISRRKALHLGLGSCLALGGWPGAEAARPRPAAASFRFLVVNDTHSTGPECAPWLEGLVRQMQRHAPIAFCLHLGDITDKGLAPHLTETRRIFDQLGFPLYAQLGNHDYATPTDRSGYEQAYPGRINYWFAHAGWQFVGLDSTEGQLYDKTHIQPATFAFLDRALPQLDRRLPTVLFTHFPLHEGVRYRPLNAEAVLERFLEFNLRAVFSGHWHGYTQVISRGAFLVTNRCCARVRENHGGGKEKGYWLCTVEGHGLTREFVEYGGPDGAV